MAGHGADELVPLEREQIHVGKRRHGRRAWDVAEERDLPEVIAHVHAPGRLVVDSDLDFSRCEDVEAVAMLSLSDDLPSGRNVHQLELVSQLLEGRRGKWTEDRDRLEELQVPGSS